ncbi:hypothetical protein RKD30_000303 [Streptomyces pristinaespiralis]
MRRAGPWLRPCQVNPPAHPAFFLRLSSRSPTGNAPRAGSVHRRPPATRASGRGPRRARVRRGRRLGRWRVLLLRASSTQAPGSASRPAACRTGRRSRPLSWSSSSSQRDRTGRRETAAVREACFWQYRGRPSRPQGATRRNRQRVAGRREGARNGASKPDLVPTCHSRRLPRLTATAIEKGRDLSSMTASGPTTAYRPRLTEGTGLTSGVGRRTGTRPPARTTGCRCALPDWRATSSPCCRRRRTVPGPAAGGSLRRPTAARTAAER